MALWSVLLSADLAPLSASQRVAAVAVLPVENLSTGPVPAATVRRFVRERLVAEGVRVLDDEALGAFMARHRVRYSAGVDEATATSLKQETGVDAVVIASVELSSEVAPPKIALFARLVSLADPPTVVWADNAGLAGDDAPGLFDLGLVNNHQALLERALDRVGDSLATYLRTGKHRTNIKRDSKFRPKAYHKAFAVDAARGHSVAVVPFFNLSGRRNAGEILALHFIRHLSVVPGFRVVDTGVVRQQLLDARIIMDGGLSISDADTVAALTQADVVLTGRVLRYDDYDGPAGRTGVEFSALLIDRKTRRVVWSSDSYNDGRDGVGFFERGASRTAHAMATQMARLTIELMAGRGR